MKSLSKTKAETFETISDLIAIRNNNGPQVILHFFFFFLNVQLILICIPRNLTLKLVLGVTEIKFNYA